MRWWNETVAAIGDVMPLPLLVLAMLTAATLTGLLWYLYPRWIPRRWPRLRRPTFPRFRRPRLRWPTFRRRRPIVDTPDELISDGDEVPELPAADFVSLADRYAAEGRYAEAVRERFRAIVRELVERGVIEHRPGWTVTELAAVAVEHRPALAGPLGEASAVFSDIWYGQRPATADHDTRMRQLTAAVHATVTARAVAR